MSDTVEVVEHVSMLIKSDWMLSIEAYSITDGHNSELYCTTVEVLHHSTCRKISLLGPGDKRSRIILHRPKGWLLPQSYPVGRRLLPPNPGDPDRFYALGVGLQENFRAISKN